MKKYFSIGLLFSLVIAGTGCKKFLDVVPKGVVIPQTVSEFDLLLNSEPITTSFPQQILYASDDVQAPYTKVEDNPDANAYFWKTQLNNSVEASPVIWGPLYRSIYNTNVVIKNVLGARDGSDIKKKQVYGEALAFRAAFYFDLVTVYSKAYNASTAASDPGIPLVSEIDVTDKTPARSSVKATFDTITNNLKTAADYLPEINSSNARLNKYAAYGLLSRVYLYMQDYTNADLYAGKALEGRHELLDYNNYFGGFDLPFPEDNPELIWHRLTNDIAAIYYITFSPKLIETYSPDDLRFQYLAVDYGTGEYGYGGPTYGTYGLNVPEIYLNKAEALVHNKKIAEAIDIINLIRINRIANYAYEPLSASGEADALQIVLQERRWELALKGTRWMDMKRLDAQGKMPAVERIDAGTGEVLETLAPKSSHYTFEIPSRVLLFNPNMEKNFK
ncbi:MAG: RagB/SusD family nutrient uptake outer membrane protein [Ginsengibacter sp.]